MAVEDGSGLHGGGIRTQGEKLPACAILRLVTHRLARLSRPSRLSRRSRLTALVALAVLGGGACEPSMAQAPVSTVSTGSAGSTGEVVRDPVFARHPSKAVYERGMAGLVALDALRGTAMTSAFATDLGFRCAGLRDVQKGLVGEQDPLVLRLTSRIDKTCNFDVPLASALFDLQRIETKRAADPGADPGSTLRAECAGLRLAIRDFGSRYLENPKVVDVIGKDLSYCGASTDTLRVVP